LVVASGGMPPAALARIMLGEFVKADPENG